MSYFVTFVTCIPICQNTYFICNIMFNNTNYLIICKFPQVTSPSAP